MSKLRRSLPALVRVNKLASSPCAIVGFVDSIQVSSLAISPGEGAFTQAVTGVLTGRLIWVVVTVGLGVFVRVEVLIVSGAGVAVFGGKVNDGVAVGEEMTGRVVVGLTVIVSACVELGKTVDVSEGVGVNVTDAVDDNEVAVPTFSSRGAITPKLMAVINNPPISKRKITRMASVEMLNGGGALGSVGLLIIYSI